VHAVSVSPGSRRRGQRRPAWRRPRPVDPRPVGVIVGGRLGRKSGNIHEKFKIKYDVAYVHVLEHRNKMALTKQKPSKQPEHITKRMQLTRRTPGYFS